MNKCAVNAMKRKTDSEWWETLNTGNTAPHRSQTEWTAVKTVYSENLWDNIQKDSWTEKELEGEGDVERCTEVKRDSMNVAELSPEQPACIINLAT